MNKIAILSDIHGNLAALERVAADLRSRRADLVVNLGDHVSGPLWPKETIRFLMAQDWIHLRGNHDRQLSEQDPAEHGLSDRYAFERLDKAEIDWLRALPACLSFDDGLLLFHGSPSSDRAYLLETVECGRLRLASQVEIQQRLGETGSKTLLCGHSHMPRVVEAPGPTLIVNPGSVGLPAYEDDTPAYHRMETGSPHARYAILERREGGWVTELIAVSYKHALAADQAGRNGRPDWEIGLRTGFMTESKPG